MEPTRAHLASAVEVIRQRILEIRARKETIGEQNTKAALIDPLLSALGWDLHQIDEVRREYKRKPQDNPVDYALFLNKKECLLIEAKSLEKDLGDRKWISQNISYAAVAGVKWCVLTNGDEYRIYNSHAEVDVEEKLFRNVNLSGADSKSRLDTLWLLSKDAMRRSLLDELWKAHLIDRKVRLAFESLLCEDDSPLIRLICKRASDVSASEARASLKRAKITIDFPVLKAPEQPAAFSPPPHAALSSVATSPTHAGKVDTEARPSQAVTLSMLIDAGLITAPLEVSSTYRGVKLAATIQPDGRVAFGGQTYDSLSTAGGMARKSVIGARTGRAYPQTNGWTFWQFRDPKTGQLRDLDSLRQEFLAGRIKRH